MNQSERLRTARGALNRWAEEKARLQTKDRWREGLLTLSPRTRQERWDLRQARRAVHDLAAYVQGLERTGVSG